MKSPFKDYDEEVCHLDQVVGAVAVGGKEREEAEEEGRPVIIIIILISSITIIFVIIIIITRPMPHYGRQGLAGSWARI